MDFIRNHFLQNPCFSINSKMFPTSDIIFLVIEGIDLKCSIISSIFVTTFGGKLAANIPNGVLRLSQGSSLSSFFVLVQL
jgi:hypothetical protein